MGGQINNQCLLSHPAGSSHFLSAIKASLVLVDQCWGGGLSQIRCM